MAFGVTLAEIKVELIVNVTPKKEMTFSTVERPLSRLAIVGFNVSGQILSDSSIQSKITLQSFLIEDTRPLLQTYSSFSPGSTPTSPTMSMPKSSSLKRIIERPISRLLYVTESDVPEQKDTKQMLTVKFEKSKEGDIKVDVHLSGFTLILCPNYLLRVLNFFTAGLPSTASKEQAPLSTKPAKGALPAHPTSSNQQADQKKSSSYPSLMTIVVTVDRPDIFLVERIDSLNTNALVLNMEMKLTLLMLSKILDVSGEISDLHIFSCLFDPVARLSTKATVLSPCRLTIKAKMSDEDLSSQVDVNIGDVTLSVSPGTIEMLANVSKSITIIEEDVVQEDIEEEEQPVAVWSNVWDIKPLKYFDFPFLETELAVEANELVIHDSEHQQEKKQLRNEQMIVVVTHFTMMIETGQGNRTSPLVLLESEMSAKVINWSSDLEVRASLSLQAAYYNSLLALWEPLLEPVDCTRSQSNGQSIKQRPWELTMRLNKQVASDIESFEFENHSSSKLVMAFESADNMELTITRSFLDVVSTLGTAFSDAVKQQLSKRDHPAALYVVHNELDKTVVLDLVNGDFIVDDPSASNPKEVVRPIKFLVTTII